MGIGSWGVISIRGVAISPLWLASITEFLGMTVLTSFTSTKTSTWERLGLTWATEPIFTPRICKFTKKWRLSGGENSQCHIGQGLDHMSHARLSFLNEVGFLVAYTVLYMKCKKVYVAKKPFLLTQLEIGFTRSVTALLFWTEKQHCCGRK